MIKTSEFIRLRESAGLSQSELARLSGTSQQHISQIENEKTLTSKKIYKIAKALGVPANQLDPDIPEHPLDEFAAALWTMEEADASWVLDRLRRDIEHVLQKPLKPRPTDGGPKRLPRHH